MSDDKTGAFAAAELASTLRGDQVSEPIRSFAGLIDNPRALRLLNYYDSLLDDPVEETALGREIIANCATATIDDAVKHGNVSQMKTGTGLTGQSEDGADLLTLAANELRHEGSIGLVFGAPGCGKTALTVDVARVWKALTGGAIIGNTSWDGFDRVVRSDEEMLEAMAEIQGPVLAVLDEIAQELSGFGSGNKAAEQFSNSLLFVRKREEKHGEYAKRGSVLLVGHTRTKTAKSIRRVASFGIEKPSRSKPDRARLLESEGGKDFWEEGETYQGITDTAENYSEHEASEFSVVLEEESETEEVDSEQLEKNEHIKTAIRACDRGMQYDDVAELVPWSSDWVGKVYRAWRDKNQHTELIPKEDQSEL